MSAGTPGAETTWKKTISGHVPYAGWRRSEIAPCHELLWEKAEMLSIDWEISLIYTQGKKMGNWGRQQAFCPLSLLLLCPFLPLWPELHYITFPLPEWCILVPALAWPFTSLQYPLHFLCKIQRLLCQLPFNILDSVKPVWEVSKGFYKFLLGIKIG